jgi:hypothetical protein
MKRRFLFLVVAILFCMATVSAAAAPAKAMIGINVVLNTPISQKILTDLQSHGNVLNVLYEINALTMKVPSNELAAIKKLPYVAAANPDAARKGAPVDTLAADSMDNGISTWDLDAINVTDLQSSVMRLGSLAVCAVLKQQGFDPIYQLTCRDRNRLALQSDILSAAAMGIQNILALTGDYPTLGDHPEAKPVFDLDSVQLLQVIKMLEAGADMIFPEAITELAMYKKFAAAVKVPVLANITEFGKTPLFTVDELRSADVAIVLYPLTAFRAMNKAALRAYEEVRKNGTQKQMLGEMQTREELYDIIGYHDYEKKLDELFARSRS